MLALGPAVPQFRRGAPAVRPAARAAGPSGLSGVRASLSQVGPSLRVRAFRASFKQ